MNPEYVAEFDQSVASNREVRQVITKANPQYRDLETLAARLAERLREIAGDEDTAREWGTALMAASTCLSAYAAAFTQAHGPHIDGNSLINLAGWAALDLLKIEPDAPKAEQ